VIFSYRITNANIRNCRIANSTGRGEIPVMMDTGKNKRWTNKGINNSWRSSAKDEISYYRYTGEFINRINGGELPEVVITAAAIKTKQLPQIQLLTPNSLPNSNISPINIKNENEKNVNYNNISNLLYYID
jgi:hypothetical protein